MRKNQDQCLRGGRQREREREREGTCIADAAKREKLAAHLASPSLLDMKKSRLLLVAKKGRSGARLDQRELFRGK